MKKFNTSKSVLSIIIILICTLSSCSRNNYTPPDTSIEDGDINIFSTKTVSFSSFEEFKNYVHDPKESENRIDDIEKYLVDLSSIIPNEEINEVLYIVSEGYSYYIDYRTATEKGRSLKINVRYSNDTSNGGLFIYSNRYDNFVQPHEGYYVCNVGGTDIYFSGNQYGSYDQILFPVGDHIIFHIMSLPIDIDNTTQAQKNFINAFYTEAGTAEMLERIKALIPKEIE